MVRSLLALLVAATGCSGPTLTAGDAHAGDGGGGDGGLGSDDGAHSGSRLKITWYTFADGTRTWNAFYDVQRKEGCYAQGPWPDGNYYCTPGSTSQLVYTNSGCTQKAMLVYRDPNCPSPPPSYGLDYEYSGCNYGPQHLYLRGGQISATQYYNLNSDGTCGGPYTASSYAFYSLGQEVAATSLALMTVTAPSGSGTLGQRFLTTSDGMQLPWTLHDASLGADCSVYTSDGASAECAPDGSVYSSYYHDATCSQPEASVQKSCTSPQYAEVYLANACPNALPKFYAIGSQVSNTPLYYTSGSSCTSTTGSTTQNYFTTGAQLQLSPLTRAPDTLASHRMQIVHATTGGGLRIRDGLWDSQEGQECYPGQTTDGATRCVSYDAYVDTYYKDASCTQAIQLASISTGPASCGAPTVPKYAYLYNAPATGECAYSYSFFPIGAAYSATVYTNYGTCAVYTPSQSKLYSLGTEADPAKFAAATVVTDP